MRTWVVMLAATLLPAVCAAQAPPAGAASMASAAGMPLQVGDLPPGTLTVRVVRGAFTEDLAGQAVELDVAGSTTQRATTGADGRATFRAPVGARVRATAQVDGERLESETFALPSAGGVRVLLIAGGAGAGAAADVGGVTPVPAAALPAGHPPIDGAAALAPVAAAAPAASGSQRVAAGVLAAITLAVFGWIFTRRGRRVRERADV